MKYTNKNNNVQEILKVYIINSITKSYILNIKIRWLVTEYALMIKFNPYSYFGHSWSYFDIQNLRLTILPLYIYWQTEGRAKQLFWPQLMKTIQSAKHDCIIHYKQTWLKLSQALLKSSLEVPASAEWAISFL